jgi:hypothetical protein
MDLKVNGTIIPLHGKFVIDIYLDAVGEQLPEGAEIRIHGGPLKLHGRPGGPGLTVICDQPIQVYERHENMPIHITFPGNDPRAKHYWSPEEAG